MARQKVEVDVTANTKGLQKGLTEAGQTVSGFQKVLGKFGPIGSAINGVLDTFGLTNLSAATAVGIGTAALGAAIGVAEVAINKYTSLGDKVRSYANVTGQSAEAASRQIGAFGELGISADVAQAGMVKLSKAVNTNEKGLAALGINVAYNVDGTRDLNGTLLNVMNAYQLTGDAVKRDAIILAAFGKAGAAMIPILETNIGQLKELEKQVASVYTQKDLDQIRQYEIAQKHLKEQQDDLGVSLGRTLLPAQAAFVESLNENIYVNKRLGDSTVQANQLAAETGRARGRSADALSREYQAAQEAKIKIDDLAQAQRDAAEAAKAEEAAETTLSNALRATVDSAFGYRQSLLDLNKAQKDAADLKGKDAEANLRLEEAYFKVSDAALKQAEDQAKLHDTTLNAAESAQVQIDTLKKLEVGLKPGSPLLKEIDDYIAKLQKIVDFGTINTNFSISTQGFATRKAYAFDEGGVVPGPVGAPVPAIVHGGETVVPAGRGGGSTIHIHIGAFYSDGPGLDRLTMAIAQRLSYATGR